MKMRKIGLSQIKSGLKKIYCYLFEESPEPQSFFHTYDVRDLFFQENLPTGFKRFDMIVRLLAIENYYGKNNYGWDYYERMQTAHLGEDKARPAVEQFRRLIESYEKNGYDPDSHIVLDNRLMLWDGSHRMALAIYFHNYSINCEVLPDRRDVDMSLTSFNIMRIGFSKEEESVIQKRFLELLNEVTEPCIATLWKPVANYYTRITDNLSYFGDIISWHDIELSDFNYGSLMMKIYSCDDGPEDGIRQKVLHQKNIERNRLRFIYININNPDYRIKPGTLNPISQTCERLKRNIRKTYKKYIDNYNDVHDGIIHMGDNYSQNIFIRELIENFDKVPVKEIFDAISPYDYVLTKTDVPYMTENYPTAYPLGKDADIICSEEHLERIYQTILDIIHKQNNNWQIKCIRKENGTSLYIYLYIHKQLIYGFDLTANYLSQAFADDALKCRVKKNNLYYTDDAHELIVRLCECSKHPEKKHHFEWVRNHYNNIPPEKYNRFLSEGLKEVINSTNL